MKNKHKVPSGLLSPKAYILFAFCFLMYTPTLKSYPILSYLISYGFPLIYILLNRKELKRFNNYQHKILFYAFLLIIISFIPYLINNTGDLSYLMVVTFFFRKVITMLSLYLMIKKAHGDKSTVLYFLYYYALTHVIHTIGTLILVLIPSFSDAWFSVFLKEASSESLFESYGYTFRIGWQGFAGFRLTLHCTLSAIFAIFLRYNTKAINTRQFVVTFMGCIVGNMFYGRSGLIITIIVGMVAAIIFSRHKIKKFLSFTLIAAAMALSVVQLRDMPVFHDWYVWMSTPITNFLTTGDAKNESINRLGRMSHIEIPPQTLLLGDGYYTNGGHYYKETDVGYIRNILYWGLFGAIVSYGITIYAILKIRVISKVFALQLLAIFLIFEYKGAVYYEFLPILFIVGELFNSQKADSATNNSLTTTKEEL